MKDKIRRFLTRLLAPQAAITAAGTYRLIGTCTHVTSEDIMQVTAEPGTYTMTGRAKIIEPVMFARFRLKVLRLLLKLVG